MDAEMQKRVHIKTFGCQMNEYDSGKMLEVLAAAEGYLPTEDPARRTCSCSIPARCERKPRRGSSPRSELWKAFKNSRPGVVIGVGGCVASQEARPS